MTGNASMLRSDRGFECLNGPSACSHNSFSKSWSADIQLNVEIAFTQAELHLCIHADDVW